MMHLLSFHRPVRVVILAVVLLPLVASAAEQDRHPDWGSNMWQRGPSVDGNLNNTSPAQRQRMLRSWTFMNKGVPEDYLGATNTVGFTTKSGSPSAHLVAGHVSCANGSILPSCFDPAHCRRN